MKHGVRLDIVNLYTESVGNAAIPKKIAEAKEEGCSPSKSSCLIRRVGVGDPDRWRCAFRTSTREIN